MNNAHEHGLQMVEAISARIARLDNALKIWAVKTHGLASAGPPPKYLNPWHPKHLMVVRGWEAFKTSWTTERKTAHKRRYDLVAIDRLEGFSVALIDYSAQLESMGVRINDGKLLEKDPHGAIPWSNTALILGLAGFAGWVAMPRIRSVFDDDSKPLSSPSLNDDRFKRVLSSSSYQRQRRPLSIDKEPGVGPSMAQINKSIVANFMREGGSGPRPPALPPHVYEEYRPNNHNENEDGDDEYDDDEYENENL